jgi:hypothetical protein
MQLSVIYELWIIMSATLQILLRKFKDCQKNKYSSNLIWLKYFSFTNKIQEQMKSF